MLELINHSVFHEIAALLVLAAGAGFVGVLLRQPLIVSFIAVGIVVGPSVLDLARSDAHIDLLAELGIATLLFLVGLKLDLKLVRSLGPVALITGLGQVAFTSLFGFGLGLALGLDTTTSLYVAVALTFSSTIIIVKLLSDKREIDSLHGRIALGMLIVQDLVVVIAMIALSAIGVGTAENNTAQDAIRLFGYGLLMLLVVGIFVRYIAEPLVEQLSRAPELLVCFAIGWAALFAATGELLGLSMELGGLLSGVSLASTRLREAMAARLAPLRDFLLLFFFIAMGSRLDLSMVSGQIYSAVILSIFVLIGNPLIVLAIMGAMGYRKRTSFLTGLTVAQISEFSLIFMAMGVALGHVGAEALGLVTLVGLITIALSTYMITYSHQLYRWAEPLLTPFERNNTAREKKGLQQQTPAAQYDILLFGLGRFGGAIAQRLQARGFHVLGIDFNPEAIKRWRAEGFHVRYGDATDPEFIAGLPLSGISWAVSAVPEHDTGITHDDPRAGLIHALKDNGFQGKIAVTSHQINDQTRLRQAGADIVFQPIQDAADQAADLISGQPRRPRFDVIEADNQRELR